MSAIAIGNWIVGPLLAVLTLLFIFRIVLTWYPEVEATKFPFNLVYGSTELFLVPIRKVVPPFGGVDISPIIWVAFISLVREILVGQQGLLRMF